MTKRRWPLLLLIYGLISLAVGVLALFVGASVAPCLGLGPNTDCIAQWEAHRNIVDQLQSAFGPWPFVWVTFFGLIAVTLFIDVVRRRRAP